MSVNVKTSARARIMLAADELAREVGPAHVSLDAVAARAGVSKGGLLYHFPSKLALLRALVEDHVERFMAEMDARVAATSGSAHEILRVYHELSVSELAQATLPRSGVLAAIVQFPELLQPIAASRRKLCDRMIGSGQDAGLVLIVFLALEGLRSMQLMDMQILTAAEEARAIAALGAMIDDRF